MTQASHSVAEGLELQAGELRTEADAREASAQGVSLSVYDDDKDDDSVEDDVEDYLSDYSSKKKSAAYEESEH